MSLIIVATLNISAVVVSILMAVRPYQPIPERIYWWFLALANLAAPVAIYIEHHQS